MKIEEITKEIEDIIIQVFESGKLVGKESRTDAVLEFDKQRATGRFLFMVNEYISTIRREAVEECVKLSDEIEMEHETKFEEWKAFKQFRNTLRDRYLQENNQ